VTEVEECGAFVYWWDGEYEGNCELPKNHKESGQQDHYDGLSWFNDDNECVDDKHAEV
jgi:hypothetical protein